MADLKNSHENVVHWYRDTYREDDPDGFLLDSFIVSGYRCGYDGGNGVLYADVFDAIKSSAAEETIRHARTGYELRIFARSYEKGCADQPQIVSGAARPVPGRLTSG